jgi:raffinose/stachyose/melibiose transport system substrate-binding protein
MVRKGLKSSIVMLLALMLVLSGCASNGGDNAQSASGDGKKKVKIRFAHTWGGTDGKAGVFKEQLDAFRASHPQIDLVEEFAPGDELKTKLKVDIASNNTPDLFMYWAGESYMRPLVDGNVALNMEDYFAASQSVAKDQWSEAVWANTAVDGEAYLVPLEATKAFFMYNKEIFDKFNLQPPATYEELKEVSKVLNENGIIPLAMGSKGSNPGHWFYSALATQFPGGVESAAQISQDFKFDADAFKQAAQIISEMRALKMFPEDTISNGDWAPSVVPYNEGKAAMLFTLPWTLNLLSKEITDKSELIHVPSMEGAVNDPATYTIGGYTMSLVINKKAFEDPAKQEAIIAVADALLSDDMLTSLAGMGMMPAKSLPAQEGSLDPFSAKVYSFTDSYSVVPFIKSMLPGAKSTEDFNRSMDELFAGVIKPEAFINRIQEALTKEKK